MKFTLMVVARSEGHPAIALHDFESQEAADKAYERIRAADGELGWSMKYRVYKLY